jgi:hypothetical protein
VGAVIRVMAESSADAYVFVQQCLQPLEALVGTSRMCASAVVCEESHAPRQPVQHPGAPS